MTNHATDEMAILNLVARLAQATDDRDADAYRACFTDKVWRSETAVAAVDDYVRDAMTRLQPMEWTHHQLFNPVIEVEPGARRAAATIDVVVELCRTDDWGVRFRGRLGGRYRMGFVKNDGSWQIDRRTLSSRYVYCEPASELSSILPLTQPTSHPRNKEHAQVR